MGPVLIVKEIEENKILLKEWITTSWDWDTKAFFRMCSPGDCNDLDFGLLLFQRREEQSGENQIVRTFDLP